MPRPAPALHVRRRGYRVYLRPPRRSDAAAFLDAARTSRALHGRWVRAPATAAAFAAYVARFGPGARTPRTATHVGYLACRRDDDALVGVFNFSEIVRGAFRSTYLGYYAFAGHAGQGLMEEGIGLALDAAFGRLRLHRVEANVQPGNARSLALVRRVGFREEGYSPRYVKIAGRWRDHVRLAILAEEWRARR
jgi:ribosomal-protein-alanine N-acetyltransferase